MTVTQALARLRSTRKPLNEATVSFANQWGILIKPDSRYPGDRWTVNVLLKGELNFDNPVSLGSDLLGQSDDDVKLIGLEVKELERCEECEKEVDRDLFEA